MGTVTQLLRSGMEDRRMDKPDNFPLPFKRISNHCETLKLNPVSKTTSFTRLILKTLVRFQYKFTKKTLNLFYLVTDKFTICPKICLIFRAK